MRRKTKEKWLTHLGKAEAAYRIKLKARKKGQHTMWSYMGLAEPSKEGVTCYTDVRVRTGSLKDRCGE